MKKKFLLFLKQKKLNVSMQNKKNNDIMPNILIFNQFAMCTADLSGVKLLVKRAICTTHKKLHSSQSSKKNGRKDE